MTRAEADAWAVGSAYAAPLYHATSRDAARTIRAEGFDLSRRRFGRVWGNGVYTTAELSVSSFYAGLFGTDAVVLELRVSVSRVASVLLAMVGDRDSLRQVLRSIPNGLARFMEHSIELSRISPGSYVRPEALTRTITEAGL